MIDGLLNALVPLCIAGGLIIGIIFISIGGAMVLVWALGGLWRALFGADSQP